MRVHFVASSAPEPRRHTRAFTMVKLLVVIGIVAVLIAILLPVLGKARAQANRVACLSNIKQLGAAILMYCNDNDGYFPTCAWWDEGLAYKPYPEDWVHWQANRSLDDSAIAKYVGRGEQLKNLLRCPADRFDGRKPQRNHAGAGAVPVQLCDELRRRVQLKSVSRTADEDHAVAGTGAKAPVNREL